MIILNKFEEWFVSEDCYGNRMVADWERPAIMKRLQEIEDISIIKGNIDTDPPNSILVDITHLWTPTDCHKEGKQIIISLSHYIRPCPCGCHEYQYQCYLLDCNCCTGECT